jgi:peptidyl-prolyl cis-trans isomerase A (cyclophilin A)
LRSTDGVIKNQLFNRFSGGLHTMTVVHFRKMIALAAVVALGAVASAEAAIPATAAAQGTAAPAPKKPATAQPAKPATAQPAKPAAKAPAKPPVAGRGTAAAPGLSAAAKAKLKNPAALKDVAPAEFRASFDTSAGPFVVLVHRSWAPKGADRFYNMVKYGFLDNARFFRVLPNFMAQFGINGDPSIQAAWRDANLTDDPVTQSNKRGMITFATAGPNSRTTQLFINFRDNTNLDGQGFAPFGEVESGMESVDKINAEHRQDPDQGMIQSQGNAYLAKSFPRLDYIKKATLVRTPPPPPAPKK